MKLLKIATVAIFIIGVSTTSLMADAQKGSKYYSKYLIETLEANHIKFNDLRIFLGTQNIINVLHIKTDAQARELFKNNGKKLLQLLEKHHLKYDLEVIKKIIKIGKLKDYEDFFLGNLQFRVGVSCG